MKTTKIQTKYLKKGMVMLFENKRFEILEDATNRGQGSYGNIENNERDVWNAPCKIFEEDKSGDWLLDGYDVVQSNSIESIHTYNTIILD